MGSGIIKKLDLIMATQLSVIEDVSPIPIGSMYGIFTYIELIFMVNVPR